MSTITRAKLAIGVAGIALFLWGTRVEDARLRWVGVAALGVAVALRFLRGRIS